MKFTVIAAFLFSIGWMSVVIAGEDIPASCCLTVSKTRISAEIIVTYTIQARSTICPIRAVRFQTIKNNVICSDPDDAWAKHVMKIVDGRTTTKPSSKPTTCYTSTTKVIPTTATTDETSPTETEISTSTTVTPAVMTITTSETETSTSTTATPAVTTIKTSTLETKISKTAFLPTSVSKEKPESTATTCGTSETTAPPTVTTTATTSVPKKNKKLSKMIIRKKGKSKKLLRKIQIRLKTTRHPNKT